LNSEEFRETFLRNDREGPTKAEKARKMADNNVKGKKEAKQRAGQSGRKEKYKGEADESAKARELLEDAGRKSAQETQKKEAHRDLRDQGETKNSSVTKRRQVRKVATMVKRLKKSPEDGELQTPTGGEVVFPAGDGWDAQQQATVSTRWRRPCAKKKKVTQLARFPIPA
jgi:hypothetical protein